MNLSRFMGLMSASVLLLNGCARADSRPLQPTDRPALIVDGLPPTCAVLDKQLQSSGSVIDLKAVPIADVLRQYLLNQRYQAAIAFLRSLPPSQKREAGYGFSLLLHQVLQTGNTEDRATLGTYVVEFARENNPESVVSQVQFLNSVVAAYLRAEQPEASIPIAIATVQIASLLEDENPNKWSELENLIQLYREASRDTEALKVTDQVSDPQFRAQMRLDLATHALKQGQTDQAKSLLSQALTVADTIPSPGDKAGVTADITAPLLKLQPALAKQRVASNLALVQSLKPSLYKAKLLVELGQQQQVINPSANSRPLFTQAWQLTQSFDLNRSHQFQLMEIGKAFLQAKQFTLAEEVFAFVRQNALEINLVQASIVRYYAEAGAIDLGLQQASKIESLIMRESAYEDLAKAAIASGKVDRGLQLASGLTNLQLRDSVTIAAIAHYVKTGKEKTALQLATTKAMPAGFLRLSENYARDRQLDQANRMLNLALQVANSISNPTQKQQALASISHQYADQFQFERALHVANQLQDQSEESRVQYALIRSVRRALEAGQDRLVQQFVQFLPGDRYKLKLLQEIASYYSITGQKAAAQSTLNSAIGLTQTFPTLDRKAALATLARLYGDIGEAETALNLFNTAGVQPDTFEAKLQHIDLLIQAGQSDQATGLLASVLEEMRAIAVSKPPKTTPGKTFDPDAAETVNQLAQLAYDYARLGDRAQAMNLLAEAVQVSRLSGDREASLRAIAGGYIRIAVQDWHTGQSDQAEQAIVQAQQLIQGITPKTPDSGIAAVISCVQKDVAKTASKNTQTTTR